MKSVTQTATPLPKRLSPRDRRCATFVGLRDYLSMRNRPCAHEQRSDIGASLRRPWDSCVPRLALFCQRIDFTLGKPVAGIGNEGSLVLFFIRPVVLTHLAVLYLRQGLLLLASALRFTLSILCQMRLLSFEKGTHVTGLGSDGTNNTIILGNLSSNCRAHFAGFRLWKRQSVPSLYF